MREIVKLDHVSKRFDQEKYIIKDLSLKIYEGEFLTLLGSSGCGKTTILRMISGLEEVTEGKIYIDGKDVTDIDPTKREVNTIFQNFALFPHMTVFENVSFGLRMKKVPKDEIKKRVIKMIKLVELEGFEDRYPLQLSGGQQQRVAIARGIVMNPKVLLLDESLCSLDLKLKKAMQIELKKIQKKLGITFIYVTHDQDEALTMSDRIIIIKDGKIRQDGTPREIYQNPKTTFVADFIGESNIIKGIIISTVPQTKVKVDDFLTIKIPSNEKDEIEDKINIIIRPENINISKEKTKDSIEGVVKDVIYDGSVIKLFIKTEGKTIFKVTVDGNQIVNEKDVVYMTIEENRLVPIRVKK